MNKQTIERNFFYDSTHFSLKIHQKLSGKSSQTKLKGCLQVFFFRSLKKRQRHAPGKGAL